MDKVWLQWYLLLRLEYPLETVVFGFAKSLFSLLLLYSLQYVSTVIIPVVLQIDNIIVLQKVVAV